MFTDFKIFIFALLIGAFVFQFFIFTTWFSTTVSSMSDSESSDNGLSENEELGHDEEMEDDGSEWEDASSDEDDDEPPARRVRQELTEGYDTADTYRPAVPFNPRRPTGPQLADQTRQDAILRFSKEVDFFKLFFSVALLQKLWDFTNAYAQEHIDDNPTYQNKAKGWDLISVSEMYGFIACLIYMGFMQLLWQEYYWSSPSLHHWTMATGFVVWFPSGTGLGQSWHFSDVMIIQLWITMKNSDMYDTWLTMSSSPAKNFSNAARKLQWMREWCDRSTDLVWDNTIKTSPQNGVWNCGSWLIQIQVTLIISMCNLEKPEQQHQEKGLAMIWLWNRVLASTRLSCVLW